MAWYTSPSGVTCVASYDFVGASSLADSYTNEANPGTFNCAPGVAPTWAYGTGLTFNGSTQYLTTGIVPADTETWSMLVRYTGASSATTYMIGSGAGAIGFYIIPRWTDNKVYYGNGASAGLGVTPGLASGVLGFAGQAAYRNGAAESGTVPAGAGTFPSIFIGARQLTSSPAGYWSGNIQAVAIYSGTLSASDVATITTAMNALPVAGLLPSMLQHAAMGWR